MNGRWMKRSGSKLASAGQWLTDLFFPLSCVGCASFGRSLCLKCVQSLKNSRFDFCPGCGSIFTGGLFCEKCREISALAGLFVLSDFHNQVARKVVHAIKYDFHVSLIDELGDLIKSKLMHHQYWRSDMILMPVPLHRRRQWWRGFNQSALIAQKISAVMGNKTMSFLRRKVNNKPQVELKADGRKNNVVGVFDFDYWPQNIDFGASLVLVDDVYTTGNTMAECAKVLKNGGFRDIWGLVLARD